LEKKKSYIGLILRVLITVSLCGVIVWQADFKQIYQALGRCNPFLLTVVFMGMVINVFISAYKWKIILAIHGIVYKFGKLNRYYFTSVFFNNFLPSNIGGDAYRIYRTMQPKVQRAGAVAAVLVERSTGFWALITAGFMGALWHAKSTGMQPEWILPALLLLGGGTALPVVLFGGSGFIGNFISSRYKIPKKIDLLIELYKDYRNHPIKTLQIIAISFAFHLFTLSWMFVLAYAVGFPVGLHKLIIGLAISNLAALLPISINGIGLLDGSFIFIMKELGMPYEGALMMMLLIRALLIPLSCIGGLFYLKDKPNIDLGKLKTKIAA
jgi:glycosyltransferase 2 family protein